MKSYVGVAVIEATVMFDLCVEDGERIEDVMQMMLNLCRPNGAHPRELKWECIDEVGPSGWPVVQVSGAVFDVEAFLDANDFDVE